MALYCCNSGGKVAPQIIKRWGGTAWSDDASGHNSGSITFTIPKDGLYVMVTGGNRVDGYPNSPTGDYIIMPSFTSLNATSVNFNTQTARPDSVPNVFYKRCKAGESYSFNWYISRWNRTGGMTATLLYFP